MSDQPTPVPEQPTERPYPEFPVTSAGVALLHRELGQRIHQGIETEIALMNVQQQAKTLAEHNRYLLTRAGMHGAGKCLPVPPSEDAETVETAEARPPVAMTARRKKVEAG